MYQGNKHQGVKLGPDTIRQGGLINLCKSYGWQTKDHGNIKIEELDMSHLKKFITKKNLNEYKWKNNVGFPEEIGAMNYTLYNKVKEAAHNKSFVLSLGGDHSIASGSIPAMKEVYPNLKVIWIDAHADINTPETSLSINYHGMPVSHCVGLTPNGTVPGFDWLNPNLNFSDIVYIGLRSVDPGEVDFLKKYNILHYDIDHVTEKGIGSIMKEIKEYFASENKSYDNPIHISFDIDGVDHQFVKQTGTICRGGLNDREANFIIRNTVATKNLVSMDLVELNPELGNEKDKKIREKYHGDPDEISGTETTCFSLNLIRSALGDRVCI